jgi:hypothetical protein
MNTDESGELDRALNEKKAPRWPFDTLNISSVGDALKYSAIAGAIIYSCLFLGYRKYYTLLGIRPEDVGVNHTFILARSVGFIVLAVICTLLAILLTAWFHLVLKRRPWTRRHAIHIAAAALVWLIVSACFVELDSPHRWLAASMGGVLTIASIAMAQFSHSPRDRQIANGALIIAAVTIVLVPVLAAIIDAYLRADRVQHGQESTPVTILGLPLLDVSAEQAHVSWICQDSQRPATFKQSQDSSIDGILVGETSTSYYIHLGGQDQRASSKIVKIPQSCAFLTRDDPKKQSR